jgi:hypothetical protein
LERVYVEVLDKEKIEVVDMYEMEVDRQLVKLGAGCWLLLAV